MLCYNITYITLGITMPFWRKPLSMKKRPIFMIIILIILCMFALASCNDAVSPVESVIISTLPKTTYYRGDAFALNGAELTVYYENGRTELIPLTLTMVSDYDAQSLGDQILQISHKGKNAKLKVTVIDAPIYSIATDTASYNTKYVQGQSLDTTNMTLQVTYINGYSETVAITEDMISGFDSSILGDQEVTITFSQNEQSLTQTIELEIIRKEIANIDLFAPSKGNYVIGQSLDMAGGYLRVAYNDNTSNEILLTDLYEKDINFKILINNEEKIDFTRTGLTAVKVYYYDREMPFNVRVEEVKVKTFVPSTLPIDQIKNGTLDLSTGVFHVTYNNETTEDLPFNDPRITNNIDNSEFNINVVGSYDVRFVLENVETVVTLNVIESKESELVIVLPETRYYQDTGSIDFTLWQYSILLTNGSLRALDEEGNTKAYLTDDEASFVQLDKDFNNDFSTTVAGHRIYQFKYTSADKRTVLAKQVDIEIIARQITGIDSFQAPTITTYMQGDTLSLDGGHISFVYNSGDITPIIPLTYDMFDSEDWNNATSVANDQIDLEFTYENTTYNTSFVHYYAIKVLKRVTSVSINASSGHSNKGIQGTYFDSSNLILDVLYASGASHNETVFDANEWTFINTYFENIGQHEVLVYYGDINDVSNTNYVTISVTVTNNILDISFVEGYLDEEGYGFADIIEGQTVTIGDNAYIKVNYENNSIIDESLLNVKITSNMLSQARNYNQTTGKRPVVVTYQGKTLEAFVNVLNRKISVGSIKIIRQPDKLKYSNGDALSIANMGIEITYDNGEISYIDFVEGVMSYYIGKDGKEVFTVTPNYDTTWEEGTIFLERSISLTIDLSITDTEVIVGGQDIVTYTTYWFDRLPEYIALTESDNTLSTIPTYEGVDNIEWTQEAVLKIVYQSGEPDYYYLSEYYAIEDNYLAPSEYTLSGFDCNKVGNQTITFSYMLYECTFVVTVLPKILVEISCDIDSITVIEGMEIDPEAISITAHYVDALGREFDNQHGNVKIELIDLVSSYDSKAEVVFDDKQCVTSVTFTFKGKSVEIELIIIQKTISSIMLSEYPKRVYTEFYSEGIDFSNGMLLAYYNNGASEFIELDSGISNLQIDSSEFNTSFEINNNNEVAQRIYISYTVNGVEKNTSYVVTIKDRKYLTVDFSDKATVIDGAYQLIYGATDTSRPTFYVMHGNTIFISNANIDAKIAENTGFTVMYRDSVGNENALFPKNAGLYTLVIRYSGDNEFNTLVDNSMKIRINKRKISINAEPSIAIYSDYAPTFTFNITSQESDGEILVFDQEYNDIISVDYNVYLDNVLYNFTQGIVSMNISGPQREYRIRPKLDAQGAFYDNYSIVNYNEAVFTINPLPIAIKASAETKVYGQAEPMYRYDVYLYDGVNNDTKIGSKDKVDNTVVANVTVNGLTIDISTYSLTRNLNLPNAQGVGTHNIIAGNPSFLSNFDIKVFETNLLTITKKSITVKGDSKSKEYGAITPNFVFSTQNSGDLVYSANLQIYDTFTSVFGAYTNPDNYVLKIYASTDIDKLHDLAKSVDGKYMLPNNTPTGDYNVYVVIDNGLIANYHVTVDPVTLTINKTDVNIFASDLEKVYGDSDPDYVYGDNYYYQFNQGYLLDENSISIEFTREIGENIGKYKVALTSESISSNTNFNITLYGENVETEFSYVYITPRNILITPIGSGKETYAKKELSSLVAPYEIASEDAEYTISEQDETAIRNAISFIWNGRTDRLQGTGWAVVDTYDAIMNYAYLSSSNFWPVDWAENLPSLEKTRAINAINDYVFNGVEFKPDEDIIVSTTCDYEITPKSLDIEVINEPSSYDFDNENIPLVYTDLSSILCSGDSITITPEISVIYEGTTTIVSATVLRNAGVYTISILDIGNFNYFINNADYSRVITIEPIEIKVVMKNALEKENESGLEYYYTSDTYDGRIKQPYDFIWVNNTNAQGNENIAGAGYYYTESYKIVSSGLATAPQTLTIYPYTMDEDNNAVYPKNAGVYPLMVNINETYKNYTVKFVSPTNNNLQSEYKYIINKRVVKIINLTSYNTQVYDETSPTIPSNANIFTDNDVATELINVKTDLTFSFTRDMDYVPEYLTQYINEQDTTSAGYFNIIVNYSRSNNYIFELDGVEHYVIKRKNIEVALNSNTAILNKQFDTLQPITQASDLSLIGGTAAYYNFDVNGVKLNVDVMAYWTSSAWTQTIPANYPVGYYAYTITPFIKTGETYIPLAVDDEYDTFIEDGEIGKKLIDWNHTYTIVPVATATLDTYGITNMYAESEGIYQIKPRNVVLHVDGGIVESRKINNVQKNAYVYYQMYKGEAITYTEVLSFMNGYVALDENYLPLDENLGFVRGLMTCSNEPASIINTEEYYMLDASAISSNNPNFKIMYPDVIYEITKLNVELSIIANNGLEGASMVYGTGYNNLEFVLDFYDKAAFITAMGLNITPEQLLISDYTNKLPNDPELFFTSNNTYQLWNDIGAVFSTSDVLHPAISKGLYEPRVLYMAQYSRNFYFTFVSVPFEVKPKVITLTEIERTYFKDDDEFSYTLSNSLQPNEVNTVNNMLAEVMTKFTNITGMDITSSAGAFLLDDPIYGGYYLRAIKNDIISVLNQPKYINYDINYELHNICDILSGNALYTYLPITVKKQLLNIRIAKSGAIIGEQVTLNDCITMTFGENLLGKNNRYEIYINGFALLNLDASDYEYNVEQSAQDAVRSSIISIIKHTELFDMMSTSPYDNGQMNTLDLNNYYDSEYLNNNPFTNYDLDFDKIYYVINKIDIYLNLQNLNKENSPFEALYSELEAFVYSDDIGLAERLDMGIVISNPEAIIGYQSEMTYSLIDLFIMMNLYNDSQIQITSKEMLVSAIEYVISQDGSNFYVNNTVNVNTGIKNTDGVKTSAGNATIALTNEPANKWYFCLGYNIICNPSSLVVYPEVKGLGDEQNPDYIVPNSGVAMVGIPQDANSFKQNLSMYVKLNYQGNPYMDSEWVDIKIGALQTQINYGEYRRNWIINLISNEAELLVGREITMSLTYQETFFFGSPNQIDNVLYSNQFKVRLYGEEDTNLISGNSYFTYDTSSYNYGDEISGNYTYTLGTYVQDDNGAYLQKNWRGTNYYTEILASKRYNYDPYVDVNGLFVKADIQPYGEDYYEIVNKDRYNIVPRIHFNGNYLLVEDELDCTPTYVKIDENLLYADSNLTTPDIIGRYLKYVCSEVHEHALYVDDTKRYFLDTVFTPDGQYMKLILDGGEYEVEINEGVNTYTMHKQVNDGNLLEVDIFSNIYYLPIVSENRYNKSDFIGSYDILDTRFRIDPNSNINDYYIDFIIYNDGVNDLFIRINNSGYYLYLGSTLLDSEMSIDELDLFDSFSHSMTLYIDKVGVYDINEELNNYYVIIVLDDCYYLKMETGDAIESFDSQEYYAKFITNEIKVTFTKFEAIAMGINAFSNDNYIADILLLPNATKSTNFTNYSYHITIPTVNMEKVEIDISELFVMGSINSVLGYSQENYYYEYYIDDILICSTSKSKPSGSPIYEFARGIYNIKIKIFIKYIGDTSVTYYEEVTKSIKISVSQNYNRIEIPDVQNGSQVRAASVSAPISYMANTSEYKSYFANKTTDIKYNKVVFDFNPNMNGEQYYLRYILKTSDYTVDMLNYVTTDNYYGLMIEHSYVKGGNYNSTKIYMRYLETLWTLDLGEMLIGGTDAWIGSHNVLEVLYVENNSYLIVTLSRGETTIFSQKIYNGCAVSQPNISGEDIARIITTEQSYTGVRIHNVGVTIYKYEVGYRMLGAVDFVDNSDNSFVSGVSTIESDTKVLVSNGDGTAYTSTSQNYYIRFKATAQDAYNTVANQELVRFVIVNNTPRLMPMEQYDEMTLTSDRGIYLSIYNISKTQRELRLYMYKYDKIYQHQVVYTFNIGTSDDLLNGEEHFIEVDMTNKQVFNYNVETAISCYQMSVKTWYYIEDDLFTDTGYAFYPKYNDMREWTTGTDRNDEEADDGNKDVYFVSNVVYSGIITLQSTILVEEYSVC